jgi:hypothetical protein
MLSQRERQKARREKRNLGQQQWRITKELKRREATEDLKTIHANIKRKLDAIEAKLTKR